VVFLFFDLHFVGVQARLCKHSNNDTSFLRIFWGLSGK